MPSNNGSSSSKVLVGNQRQAIVEINQWDMSKHHLKYMLKLIKQDVLFILNLDL